MRAEITEERTDTRLPYELGSVLAVLGDATAALIDETASYTGGEEIYAVFDAGELLTVYAYLTVALARYASHLTLEAIEESRRILLLVRGRRRNAHLHVSATALLPECTARRAELLCFLRENGMAFDLREEEDALTLVLSLPRFLTDHYDVCAVKPKEVYELLFEALCRLAGVGRKPRKTE